MNRSRTLLLLAALLLALLGMLVILRDDRAAAILAPPRGAPVVAAAYSSAPEPADEPLDHVVAEPSRAAIGPPIPWSVGAGSVQLSGRVVDEHGAPLAGASLVVAEIDSDKPGVVNCLTGADGRFEARGSWTSAQVVVRALHGDCWNCARRTLARGSTGVELALEHGAELGGRFATENRGPLPDMNVSIVNLDTGSTISSVLHFRTEPASFARESGAIRCTPKGEFSCPGLRPGRYSIGVRMFGVLEPVAEVNGIELRGGERWSGPECDPLLLRSPAEVEIELELGEVDPLGPADRLLVFLGPAGQVGRFSDDTIHSARHTGSSSGTKVIIDAVCVPELPGTSLVPGQPVRLHLPGPGRYEVLVYFERPKDTDGRIVQLPIESSAPQIVEVPDGVELAHARIELDPAQRAKLRSLLVR